MAEAKANGLLKWAVPAVVGGIIVLGVYAFKGRNASTPQLSTKPDTVIYDLTDDEQKELGLTAGDTPHDTLKTLLGAVKQTRADVKAVREENERLKRENTILKDNAQNISQQIADALDQKQAEFNQQIEVLRNEVSNGNSSPPPTTPPAQNYPIGGLGLDGEQGQSAVAQPVGLPPISEPKKSKETKWITPSDVIYRDKQGKVVDASAQDAAPAFPNPFKALDESPLGQAADTITNESRNNGAAQKSASIPYFTVPPNSTFLDAVSMTALIGRVPIDGNVTDPYPFKVIVKRENLISNGIELPDIEGAIISGTASGDWTLSCVRGRVESMTFVFSDGRIVTTQDQKGNSNADKGIGWLSSPDGVQCVPGTRKTNAPEFLTSQFLLAGAGAAAQGLSQGQTTTMVDGTSVVSAVTGNQGQFILGQALGGGLKETTEWFRKRYGQNFDAIYVPPGQPIAVHITQELKIDYNPNGRKVKYQRTRAARGLD